MNDPISTHPLYFYVSTKAACDPVKTIYLCAPEPEAATVESAKRFAEAAGWQALAEENAAVLVVPAAPSGWAAQPPSLFQELFRETRNRFKAPAGESIPGLNGVLMCWEPIIYGVGYAEGAKFLGNSLTNYPNTFAAAALVGGGPDSDGAGDLPSNHWLVDEVSGGYSRRNRDIPVHVWLFPDGPWGQECEPERGPGRKREPGPGSERELGREPGLGRERGPECECKPWQALADAAKLFVDWNRIAAPPITTNVRGLPCRLWRSDANCADQVRLFDGTFCGERELARLIMEECFNHVVRWKDGPDGKLALVDSRAEFYRDPRFIRRTIITESGSYDYFVHLPEGMSAGDAAGLPLVFTVHGRGEPAWMFTTKNGWDRLADETREFVLVSPDSEGNVWFLDRDSQAFAEIVEDMVRTYQIDASRVYLTGFSNGGMITREVGMLYPQLFAAISPWNAPRQDTVTMHRGGRGDQEQLGEEIAAVAETFLNGGWQLPCAFVYGDSDNKAPASGNLLLGTFLRANGCNEVPDEVWRGASHYPPEAGYAEGDRLTVRAFCGPDGTVRVTETIVRDMPHGAMFEESRAVWEFLKPFYRRPGETEVRRRPGCAGDRGAQEIEARRRPRCAGDRDRQ